MNFFIFTIRNSEQESPNASQLSEEQALSYIAGYVAKKKGDIYFLPFFYYYLIVGFWVGELNMYGLYHQ